MLAIAYAAKPERRARRIGNHRQSRIIGHQTLNASEGNSLIATISQVRSLTIISSLHRTAWDCPFGPVLLQALILFIEIPAAIRFIVEFSPTELYSVQCCVICAAIFLTRQSQEITREPIPTVKTTIPRADCGWSCRRRTDAASSRRGTAS